MATFTAAEQETVREVIQWKSRDNATLADLLSSLNDAAAAATRNDLAAYSKIKYGTAAVHGGYKGTDYDIQRDRLLIANRIRLRLNLDELPGDLGSREMGTLRLGGGNHWIG